MTMLSLLQKYYSGVSLYVFFKEMWWRRQTSKWDAQERKWCPYNENILELRNSCHETICFVGE